MRYILIVLAGLLVAGCPTTKRGGSSGRLTEGSEGAEGGGGILPVDGRRDIVEPVYFAYDSASIHPDQSGKIEAVAKHLKSGKGQGVILEGHADERGSREYNLALGEVRCLAVRDYLIELGVSATAIQTKSYGEEQPANEGHDDAAWSRNRRVVFAIY